MKQWCCCNDVHVMFVVDAERPNDRSNTSAAVRGKPDLKRMRSIRRE